MNDTAIPLDISFQEEGLPSTRTAGPRGPETTTTDMTAVARHGDPSVSARQTGHEATKRVRPGATWVRPSDLAAAVGARAAGQGIDFQAELARRARRLPIRAAATTGQAMSGRARRLLPVGEFGVPAHTSQAAARSGIGLR